MTSALQAFIDSVPNGACISFPRRGSYRAEGTISLTDRNDLTLYGNSSTIFATTHGPAWPEPGRQQLVIVGGSHITVKALRIRSVNTSCTYDRTYEFEAGVAILGAADVRLVNLWIRNVSGDFVYVDARRLPDGFVPPSNITIRNAPTVEPAGRFRCSGRQGIAAGSGTGLVFRNLYLKSTALIPFDLENMPDQEIRGVSIIANTVEAPFGAYLVAAASVYGTGTHDVAVRGNRVIGKWLGVALDNNAHSDWTVTGNTSDTPAGTRSSSYGVAFRTSPFGATCSPSTHSPPAWSCTWTAWAVLLARRATPTRATCSPGATGSPGARSSSTRRTAKSRAIGG